LIYVVNSLGVLILLVIAGRRNISPTHLLRELYDPHNSRIVFLETIVTGPKNLSRFSMPGSWSTPKRSQREAGIADSEMIGIKWARAAFQKRV
jgi:hypothetical protein